MSKANRRRRKIPFEDKRIIPLSARAVHEGFEETFADDNPEESFARAVTRVVRRKQVFDFLSSLEDLSLVARLVPEWEPTERVADAKQGLVIGGAAIFLACAEREAVSQNVQLPRITMPDRTYFVNALLPSEQVELPVGSPDYAEAMAKNLVGVTAERVRNFDMVETEFCTKLLEATPPELGYNGASLHDFMMGASHLHHLYDAHYERRALQAMTR